MLVSRVIAIEKADFGQNVYISVRSYKRGCFKVVEFDGRGLREGLAAKDSSGACYFCDGDLAENKAKAAAYALKQEQQYESDGVEVKRGGIPYWREKQCIHVVRDEAAETPVCGECGVKPFTDIDQKGENR